MKKYILIVLCLVALFSCKKTDTSLKDQQTDLLCSKKWKFVKYNNQSMSFNGYTYEHKKDGSVIIYNVYDKSTIVRYWRWVDDGKTFELYHTDNKTLANTTYILELNDKQFVYYTIEPDKVRRDVTAEPYTN